MEQLINDICEKTGIDRSTAEKVAGYLKENATRLPELIRGGGGGMGGGIKGTASGVADKVGDVLGRR